MKEFKINRSLLPLKCVLFLFFGALGSLLPFLPLHMVRIGLSRDESITVSIVAPLIAALGPLIACPLADWMAGGFGGASRSKTGTYLRVMLATCFILAPIFYWLLMLIPTIVRNPPKVIFTCDEKGGYILQDPCGSAQTCYDWAEKEGSVLVKNCKFSCNVTTEWTNEVTTPVPEENTSSYSEGDYPYEENSGDYLPPPESDLSPPDIATSASNNGMVPLPHMCYNSKTDPNEKICEVYTEYSRLIDFKIGLKPSPQVNNTEVSDHTCRYPFADDFHCRIPNEIVVDLRQEYKNCNPVVACTIHSPYNNTDSLLRISQCGYNNISYYLYVFIRSVADIFPAAAVALLATAIVIATRETSTGRGDIGKQLAAGALGFVIFPPLIGGLAGGEFLPAMISFTVLMILAALLVLIDREIPLSPPEWWWHTRCGLLALPMSSVRKYGVETIALAIVLFLLGVFWNAIDAFLPWHISKLDDGSALMIGLTFTVAALPAMIYFIFAEAIVDYYGHSNILIMCFVSYIIHHLALILIKTAGLLLLCEVLEVFTLHFMWVTAILYLRHLVPRRFTSCGQALAVVAHFCLGRCIGAVTGSLAYTEYPDNFKTVHKWFAIAAAIVAIIYFILYHFYLKVYYLAPTQLPPYPAPAVVQSANGNGNYTPLRVYHNSSSKKGHFRY